MPYIKQHDRKKFKNLIENATELLSGSKPGDLNYLITSIVHGYVASHGISYATYNDVIGVLECAKLELYRRKVAPYEDIKAEENGDVGHDHVDNDADDFNGFGG